MLFKHFFNWIAHVICTLYSCSSGEFRCHLVFDKNKWINRCIDWLRATGTQNEWIDWIGLDWTVWIEKSNLNKNWSLRDFHSKTAQNPNTHFSFHLFDCSVLPNILNSSIVRRRFKNLFKRRIKQNERITFQILWRWKKIRFKTLIQS